jgi:hypothetical protein
VPKRLIFIGAQKCHKFPKFVDDLRTKALIGEVETCTVRSLFTPARKNIVFSRGPAIHSIFTWPGCHSIFIQGGLSKYFHPARLLIVFSPGPGSTKYLCLGRFFQILNGTFIHFSSSGKEVTSQVFSLAGKCLQ